MTVLNSPRCLLAMQASLVVLVTLMAADHALCAASNDQARVTRIVRDVKLLPTGAKAKPASINDQVNANTVCEPATVPVRN